MLAEHAVRVVINDFAGVRNGERADSGLGEEVGQEIRERGGRAVADASSSAES